MNRQRKAFIKDLVRRHVQGVVENLELFWVFENEYTDEEWLLMEEERNLIARKIGKTRDFSSFEQDEKE